MPAYFNHCQEWYGLKPNLVLELLFLNEHLQGPRQECKDMLNNFPYLTTFKQFLCKTYDQLREHSIIYSAPNAN